jgi:uncharacterized membrane protein YjjP (DUF1212 family)
MLRAGAASFRTEEVMERTATALGITRLEAYITPTGIIASAFAGDEQRTTVVKVRGLGVDMNRVVALELFSRRLPRHSQPEAVAIELEALEQVGLLYRRWQVILAAALAFGSFAVILGGGLAEFAVAFCGAGLTQSLRFALTARRFTLLATTTFAAALATLITSLLSELLLNNGVAMEPPYAIVAAVLLMVPGVPLVTAAIDLVHFDLVSGLARLAFTVLVLAATITGMLAVLVWTGDDVLRVTVARNGQDMAATLGRIAFAAIAGFGFSVLLNTPRRALAIIALLAAAGYSIRYVALMAGTGLEVATFIGTLCVGLLGYFAAVRFRWPRLVFTVTGSIIFVPGIPAFEVLVDFSRGDTPGGLASAVQAVLVTGALVAGLTIARGLTDFDWRHILRAPAPTE